MRIITILLILVATPVVALAQNFPGDSAYVAFRCGNGVMVDDFADESGALDERDIVGDTGNAAGLRAADATHLFLRMRLEDDPAPAAAVAPFSWGVEFDTDGDLADYEILVLVSGIGGTAGAVTLQRNTTTAQVNDPTDPAEQQVQTYTFAANARTTTAPGTNYGGNADFFLSIAVPWADLAPIGLDRDTAVSVWVASSSSPNSLNGDFACHSSGRDGPITLTDDSSDPTTADPDAPPVGGPTELEGGSGCSTSRGTSLWLLLALLPFARRKPRHAR